MQIVIEIPEAAYLDAKYHSASLWSWLTDLEVQKAIRNGTPLPKAENHGFIAVCDNMYAVTQEVVDKLKDTVFVGDKDCSYCFDIMEIIEADGGDAE